MVETPDLAAGQREIDKHRMGQQIDQQNYDINKFKLEEARKAAGQSGITEEQFMQQVVEEAQGDPTQIPSVLMRKGRIKEAMEFLKGWDEHQKAQQGPPETGFTLSPGQARYDAKGQVIAQGPDAPASAQAEGGFTLSPGQQRFGADGKPIASVPRPPATGGAAEPLVAVMGPDGRPVLVRRSQAEGKQPASSREQGRAVTSGDAGRITDLDASLNDLSTLKQTVSGTGSTGIAPSIGAAMPNFVTNATGFGVGAKERQAVIDRVKQVIGKALEGGVLRKEDEIKYAKILPTISDNPQVVATKLAGLETAIRQRKSTMLDNLADAGYDTSRFESRASTAAASGSAAGGIKVGPYTVREKK